MREKVRECDCSQERKKEIERVKSRKREIVFVRWKSCDNCLRV